MTVDFTRVCRMHNSQTVQTHNTTLTCDCTLQISSTSIVLCGVSVTELVVLCRFQFKNDVPDGHLQKSGKNLKVKK